MGSGQSSATQVQLLISGLAQTIFVVTIVVLSFVYTDPSITGGTYDDHQTLALVTRFILLPACALLGIAFWVNPERWGRFFPTVALIVFVLNIAMVLYAQVALMARYITCQPPYTPSTPYCMNESDALLAFWIVGLVALVFSVWQMIVFVVFYRTNWSHWGSNHSKANARGSSTYPTGGRSAHMA
jgi:hypothetical protein